MSETGRKSSGSSREGGGGGDASVPPPSGAEQDSQSSDKRRSAGTASSKSGAKRPSRTLAGHGERKRKDGTKNKMSFDVDELEEGMYIEVEDEEDVEEVEEYEEVPDEEAAALESGTGALGTEGTDPAVLHAKGDKAGEGLAPEEASGYKIRPDLAQKFRPGTVQVLIEKAIRQHLEGREYSLDECDEWVKLIVEEIHEKVKGQNYKRYKLITNITLGERRGEGASSATRCLWDAEADCMATYTFLNDSMFCNGTVYGIYFY